MGPKYGFKSANKKKISNLTDVYINKHSGKIKKGKEYDLVGQMPKRMQKRYFDAIKNK